MREVSREVIDSLYFPISQLVDFGVIREDFIEIPQKQLLLTLLKEYKMDTERNLNIFNTSTVWNYAEGVDEDHISYDHPKNIHLLLEYLNILDDGYYELAVMEDKITVKPDELDNNIINYVFHWKQDEPITLFEVFFFRYLSFYFISNQSTLTVEEYVEVMQQDPAIVFNGRTDQGQILTYRVEHFRRELNNKKEVLLWTALTAISSHHYYREYSDYEFRHRISELANDPQRYTYHQIKPYLLQGVPLDLIPQSIDNEIDSSLIFSLTENGASHV